LCDEFAPTILYTLSLHITQVRSHAVAGEAKMDDLMRPLDLHTYLISGMHGH
jgi:hypothetical protein